MRSKTLRLGILLMGITTINACTRIGPGHVGIVVSMAGSNRGVDAAPETTGWVFYNPLGTQVLEYPTFVQTAKWTKSPHEGSKNNEEITFTNSEGVQFAVDVSLSYHLVQGRVPYFYVKFRSDDLNNFTHGFLRNVARDEFENHGGKYNTQQVMGDNAPFIKAVRESIQAEVDRIGVELDQFGLIGAPRPPDNILTAINLKAQAAQITGQKEQELLQVRADALKVAAKADGEASAAVSAAKGAAEATRIAADADAYYNRTLAASLTPLLLENRRVSAWDGKLPQVNGGSTNPFISLEKK